MLVVMQINGTQALTEMTRQIRAGKAKTALVLANGGVMTYQHAICLSSIPRSSDYPFQNPLPEMLSYKSAPAVIADAEGEASIEVRHEV